MQQVVVLFLVHLNVIESLNLGLTFLNCSDNGIRKEEANASEFLNWPFVGHAAN